MESMVRRIYRDAFGVNKFCEFLETLRKAEKIDEGAIEEIAKQVKKLGLRIISDEPRKTKIVAAFALWFSALKPIYFQNVKHAHMDNETINAVCGYFNLWVTQTYLKKFGRIEWGNDVEDAVTRRRRFIHDFTYRAINMSSFEFFYGSIFRATPEIKPVKSVVMG
jgi:hypothetical protein